MSAGFADAIHRRVVGAPSPAGRVHAQDRVERRKLQFVGHDRIAGQFEHLARHGHPGNRAAGFDGTLMVGISLGLLAGREAAVVMAIKFDDAPPPMLEGVAVLHITGEIVEPNQAQDGMQTFPTRLGGGEELLACQRRIEVVPCQGFAGGIK